jgi:uncharacterized CHY-type Zn-finger protein
MERLVGEVEVHGVGLDEHTRCEHYHGATDIVAIKMACCGSYYACITCHEQLADHPVQPWGAEALDTAAVLCGACGTELSIRAYVASGSACPSCGAAFNPRCELHWPLYFDVGMSDLPHQTASS